MVKNFSKTIFTIVFVVFLGLSFIGNVYAAKFDCYLNGYTLTYDSETGKLVGVKVTDETEDVMLITDKGTIIRLNVKEISVLGRSTQGVTLMRTNDGGKVVSIETLSHEDVEEDK